MTNRLLLGSAILLATTPLTAGEVILVGAGARCRKHVTFFPPRVTTKAAKELKIAANPAARAAALARRIRPGFRTDPPPDDWTRPDFDDRSWLHVAAIDLFTGDSRMPAGAPLFYARGTDRFVCEAGLISTRCKFRVHDPRKVKRLTLSIAHRGGFVACLNGVEVARGAMPRGRIEPTTPAEPYPLEAFFAPAEDGKKRPALHWWHHKKKEYHKYWRLRERSAGPIAISPAQLRKGLNVLAIELHRTEYPAACAKGRSGLCFATLGLGELFLRAETEPENVVTATRRPAGVRVWNAHPWEAVYTTSLGDPAEPLRPLELVAARNGTFSGQVVLGSTSPIRDLEAALGELTSADGRASIGARHVQVRYGAVNPTYRGSGFSRSNGIGGARFDGLLAEPPAQVESFPIGKVEGARAMMRTALGLPIPPKDAAVIPIWVTVRVPRDACPGTYRGTLAVRAKDVEPIFVPVELTVTNWTLPDVKGYRSLIFLYQSPESLAAWYKVAMWSEPHWKLIEKSLALMGGIGNIGLIVPFTAKSVHGNPETMVYWVRRPDGSFEYDWTNFDRYLKTAMKYHHPDRIRVAAINVWGNEVRPARKTGKMHGAVVTTRDPKTGERKDLPVPKYGTKACEAFWRPVLLAVKERLATHGLEETLTLGVASDSTPPPAHVAMFRRILPDAPWFRESHYDRRAFRFDPDDRRKVVPVRCNSIVWGGGIPDPQKRRLYGWRYNPGHLVLNFNRPGAESLCLIGFAPPWNFRIWMESTLVCGRNGNGRVGGDYFKLGINLHKRWKGRRVSSEAGGGSRGTLFGSYPYSSVGQTGLGNSTTDLFMPGPDGPITTARFENAREGNQEAEARIAVEKALLAQRLPAPLAEECQRVLDDRTNRIRMWRLRGAIGSGGWQDTTRRLFELAARAKQAARNAGVAARRD
jgi:hypothetical protein